LEEDKEEIYQGNAHGNDNVVYGNGERGRNSNIVGKRRFKWLNVILQMIKGQVVTCDPQEAILMIGLVRTMLGFASYIVLRLCQW
jgi:hypothetical protein